MKILKEKSRTYNGQSYYKFKVNIPEIVLNGCKLKEGDELDVVLGHESVTLKKKSPIKQ